MWVSSHSDLRFFYNCLLMLHKASLYCSDAQTQPSRLSDLFIIFNVSDRFMDEWSAGIGGVRRSGGFVHVDLSWLHKLVSISASLYCLDPQ